MHLCYMKPRDIEATFKELELKITSNQLKLDESMMTNMTNFLDYFRKTWMNMWPLSLWSSSEQLLTTNNICESYHSSLSKRINFTKPSLDSLLLHWGRIDNKELRINLLEY